MDKVKKTTKLKQLLNSNEISYFMEAHNAICGKIVEEAGFDGVWGSSLTLSASLGMRDNNEVSWKEVVDNYDYISNAIKGCVIKKLTNLKRCDIININTKGV